MTINNHKPIIQLFWIWYERHYAFNVALAAGLFVLQLVHLYWLTADVVLQRLINASFFSPPVLWENIIIVVDYTEIPAILSTSILYINELRRRFRWQPFLFLFFINSQWLHLFWITDEFIIHQLLTGGAGTVLPFWTAWLAISIDYLELPVIVDTVFKLVRALTQKSASPQAQKHAERRLDL